MDKQDRRSPSGRAAAADAVEPVPVSSKADIINVVIRPCHCGQQPDFHTSDSSPIGTQYGLACEKCDDVVRWHFSVGGAIIAWNACGPESRALQGMALREDLQGAEGEACQPGDEVMRQTPTKEPLT